MKTTTQELLKIAKPFRGIFVVALITMFCSGLASILPSWFVKISIDGLAAIQNHQETFNILPKQLLDYLSNNNYQIDLSIFVWHAKHIYYVLPLAIIVVFLVEAVFKFLYQYYSRLFGLRVVKSLRDKYHDHINQLSMKRIREVDSGSLTSIVSSDLQSLQSWIAETVMNLFSESFTAFFLFVWLLVVNWKLTIFSTLVIPLFAIPVFKLGKSIRTYARKGQDFVGNISTFMTETIKNQSIVKAFNLEAWRQKNFVKESDQLFNLFDKWIWFMALVSPVTNLIAAFGIASILFFGLKTVNSGEITVGEFSSFFVTSILLYDPVKRLGRVATIYQSALGVAERIFEILNLPSQVEETGVDKSYVDLPKQVQGELELKNVSFQYASKKLFENFNLKIPAHSSLALVGPSGGGKTTLASLIPRFYEIDSGTISLDGINIQNLSLADLRQQIALVTQEPLLFSGTLRENILVGLRDYEKYSGAELDALLEQALESSFVANFASQLEKGLDTDIGEAGSKLSIGQKQRISIARAFISNAPIIILDEPTSALDNESQEFIYRSITKLMESRTVIIIAHRLSTIKHCDLIVYLENGKIVEQGSHDELANLNLAYASLLKM